MAHRFTCGEKRIWQKIEKSQNIMKLIVDIPNLSSFCVYPKRGLVNDWNGTSNVDSSYTCSEKYCCSYLSHILLANYSSFKFSIKSSKHFKIQQHIRTIIILTANSTVLLRYLLRLSLSLKRFPLYHEGKNLKEGKEQRALSIKED